MVHVAMFDAVNAIDPQYRPYLSLPPVTAAVDARAAAAAAAYGVLVRLHPTQQPALDLALAASLASIPDGPEKTAGLALGDQVAVAMIARRAGDNFFLPNPVYVPGTGPAAYQLTPPAFVNPVNPERAALRALRDDAQQPVPPQWAAASRQPPLRRRLQRGPDDGYRLPEPGRLRAHSGADDDRVVAQREQAHRQFSRIARILTLQGPADILETARNFALLGLAMGDGFVSSFEAIYAYHFVRPVTAIRAGDADGVPGTVGDPTWTPHFVTSPFPEYPSSPSPGRRGAGDQERLRQSHELRHHRPTVPGVTRHFEDIDAFLADVQVAEIYQGIQFRTAVVDGRKQGKKVGKLRAAAGAAPARR